MMTFGLTSMALLVIVLIQRLRCDTPQQLAGEDAEQRPRNLQGVEDGPGLVGSLHAAVVSDLIGQLITDTAACAASRIMSPAASD